MTIITKKQIIERIERSNIRFQPSLDTFQMKGHAVDLRLGFTYMIPKAWHMTSQGREALNIDYFDKGKPQHFDVIELEQGQYFELLPQEYIMASTLERITVPNDLMAILYPRSSTNRKGLSVDLTGIIDAGYEGQLVIPVRNNTQSQVVRLYPGERFCQVVFEKLETPIEDEEKSRYHQKDVVEGFIRKNTHLGHMDDIEQNFIKEGTILDLKKEFPI